MRVGKRPVETKKDGNEDWDRTGRNEIEKVGGDDHDQLPSIGCILTRPAHHRRGSEGSLCRPCSWVLPRSKPCPTERRILPCFRIVIGHRRCSRSSFCASYCRLAEVGRDVPHEPI